MSIAKAQKVLGTDGRPVRLLTALWHTFGGECFYCGRWLYRPGDCPPNYDRAPTKDHVIPKCDGGANGPVVLACRRCNHQRGNLPAHIYMLTWATELPGAA